MNIERREIPSDIETMSFDEYLTRFNLTLVIYTRIYSDNTRLSIGRLKDSVGNIVEFNDSGEIFVTGFSDEIICRRMAAAISGRVLRVGMLLYSVCILRY